MWYFEYGLRRRQQERLYNGGYNYVYEDEIWGVQ